MTQHRREEQLTAEQVAMLKKLESYFEYWADTYFALVAYENGYFWEK